MSMTVSKNGIDLIKKFEGCRLTAYKCPAGIWTIGWGTTNADKEVIEAVLGKGARVKDGLKITQKQANTLLKKSVAKKYDAKVNKYQAKYKFNQNQFDALVSFAYNVGSIDTLVQNGARTIKQISEKILAYNKAGGKELAGLTRRRKAEKALFDKKCKKS